MTLAMLSTCVGCVPIASPSRHQLCVSGAGNGDAGGTWTDHFSVPRQPWKFTVHIDCSHAGSWGFDVTLEQMHPRGYFDAVPIGLGWSAGQGPASATAVKTIHRTGEFWFIVRAARGCTWSVRSSSA
jgi:hypothetical protein